MRKKTFLLAAGTAIALMVAGCSANGTGGQTTTAPVESQTETETETAAPESSEEASQETGEGEVSSETVRMTGTITEITDGDMLVDSQVSETEAQDGDTTYSGEVLFHIDSENTRILDAVTGLPVALEDLEAGSSFVAYLGPAMTMSLPPQTTPELILVQIPEDFRAPLYVTAGDAVKEQDGAQVLTTQDGAEYTVAEDAEVSPFLTKNIVTLADIEAGSKCLIWLDDSDQVTKLVLFAD